MTETAPAIMTPEEARSLLNRWVQDMGAVARPQYQRPIHGEPIMEYYDGQRTRRRQRLERASRRLHDLYDGDIPATELVPIEAANQWAITDYGLLCLDEPGYRLDSKSIFDRHLIAHMDAKGWLHLGEFVCCLVYARAYASREGEWQYW